jgi:hypothetical protein
LFADGNRRLIAVADHELALIDQDQRIDWRRRRGNDRNAAERPAGDRQRFRSGLRRGAFAIVCGVATKTGATSFEPPVVTESIARPASTSGSPVDVIGVNACVTEPGFACVAARLGSSSFTSARVWIPFWPLVSNGIPRISRCSAVRGKTGGPRESWQALISPLNLLGQSRYIEDMSQLPSSYRRIAVKENHSRLRAIS